LPAAREAIRDQLWEQPDQARIAAARLSPAGRATIDLLEAHKKEALSAQLMRSIGEHAQEMSQVSPHGHLAGLHVPVLLLHGVGDTVIPTSETLWLETDVPKPWLQASLITPVLSHVDVGKGSAMTAKLDLVRFIAAMLEETDKSVHAK
jgi:pimeloyl-ACP methyl ester carboxylesterase